ncbi:MAG: hypothetical protein JWM74_2168 [Myxococcaceae bacterium]|nr:hypothetical protein [Myxococcaceae bacterium]
MSVVSVAAAVGCATLIGADFDGAHVGDDASTDSTPLDAEPDAVLGDAPTLADVGPVDLNAVGDLQLWLAANDGVVTTPDPDAGPPPPVDAGDGAVGPPFDAGQAPANAIRRWSDLSLHGHDATQNDGVRRPTLVPDGLAGMPVVHFQRTRQTCLRATWAGGLTGKAATVFVVTRGDPTSLVRFQGGLTPGAFVFPHNSKYFVDASPELNVLLYNPPEQRLVRVDHDESAWQVSTTRVVVDTFGGVETWRNGLLSEKSSFFVPALPNVDVLGIGCYAVGIAELADADVAEILFYGSELSDASRVAVEHYLQSKWKL